MKNGVELIAQERDEQINKHGHTDLGGEYYRDGQLARAAVFCLTGSSTYYPTNWDNRFYHKAEAKSKRLDYVQYKLEMLKIAGAFCAAEIDRLQRELELSKEE